LDKKVQAVFMKKKKIQPGNNETSAGLKFFEGIQ